MLAEVFRPQFGRRVRGVVVLAATLTLVGCADRLVSPLDPSGASQIQLDPSSATPTSLNEIVQFTARVLDRNGAEISAVPLAWTSSDPTVLVSEGNGRFRTRGNGNAIVTVGLAQDNRGPKQTAQVVVRQQPTEIRFSADSLVLSAIGQTVGLQARAFDALGSEYVDAIAKVWRSENPAIATVDNEGTVTAKGDGEVVISVQVGELTKAVVTRVSSTVRIGGCISSADVVGNRCRSVLISVRAER